MGIAQQLEKLAREQGWLDEVADRLQPALRELFDASGPAVRNALYGTWLGHPLHPAIVSLPLGAWSMAVTLDALESLGERHNGFKAAADAAVGFGVLSAVAAAAAGMADWKETNGEARRVGMVHAALNTAGLALFAKSWLLRQSDERSAAHWTARLGIGAALASAILGGDLVYGYHIGVNHAETEGLPDDFVPVLPDSELVEGASRRVMVQGVPVLVARLSGRVVAIGERCSHLGGPLSEGPIDDGIVTCPWHGSRFALDDGRVIEGPATFPEPSFEARVRNGQIEVRAASATEEASATEALAA
jgi:nitrite reductase/ring-hydroxylating ferredoxin subunit/uncharacterized membrane protein